MKVTKQRIVAMLAGFAVAYGGAAHAISAGGHGGGGHATAHVSVHVAPAPARVAVPVARPAVIPAKPAMIAPVVRPVVAQPVIVPVHATAPKDDCAGLTKEQKQSKNKQAGKTVCAL